jgi:hypothetical protein
VEGLLSLGKRTRLDRREKLIIITAKESRSFCRHTLFGQSFSEKSLVSWERSNGPQRWWL